MRHDRQPVYPWEVVPAPQPAAVAEPDPDPSEAERLACRDVWRVGPSTKPAGGPLEPLSREWFLHLDGKRYRRHGRWVPALLEFTRHARENMLAVGDGLGLDWVRYRRGRGDRDHRGPVGRPAAAVPRAVRRPRGDGPVRPGPVRPAAGPGRPGGRGRGRVQRPPEGAVGTALAEAYRVLRPGGKMMCVLPAKYNAAKWQDMLMPWRTWFRTVPKGPPRFTRRELTRVLRLPGREASTSGTCGGASCRTCGGG